MQRLHSIQATFAQKQQISTLLKKDIFMISSPCKINLLFNAVYFLDKYFALIQLESLISIRATMAEVSNILIT